MAAKPSPTLPQTPLSVVCTAIRDHERIWVHQAPKVWFRPTTLNTVHGQWCNLLRVR